MTANPVSNADLHEPEPTAEETIDICFDGTPWPTTPEGIERWLARFDAHAADDGAQVDCDFDWPGWDEFQKEAVRKNWEELERQW